MSFPSTAPGVPRPALVRQLHQRELAGVCAGLAVHLGMDVRAVRLLIVLLTPLGGAGAVAYGFLWFTLSDRTTPTSAQGTVPGPARRLGLPSASTMLGLVGAVLIGAALAGLVWARGWSLDLHIWLPLVAVAAGVLFVWAHLDQTTRAPGELAARLDGSVGIRIGIGVVLTVLGMVLLLTTGRSWREVGSALVAAVVVLVGVTVLATPWVVRLWRDLRAEQVERVRATERADIAAHLHDSVLQTLALIQRNSGDAARVGRLARGQERELRRWLFTDADPADDTLAAAVEQVAVEVEDAHGIPVEVVVIGDRRVGEAERALVGAVREALVNAVRHARPPVSAYVEVGPRAVEAFVRDHGAGFDVDAVPEDRLGVRESILGRMHRIGGRARIRRLDEGTEVQISLPVADGPDVPRQHQRSTDDPGGTGRAPTNGTQQ